MLDEPGKLADWNKFTVTTIKLPTAQVYNLPPNSSRFFAVEEKRQAVLQAAKELKCFTQSHRDKQEDEEGEEDGDEDSIVGSPSDRRERKIWMLKGRRREGGALLFYCESGEKRVCSGWP